MVWWWRLTIAETIPIFFYFVFRIFLQFYNRDGLLSIDTIRKYRIILGALWLPLGSLVYLNSLIYFITHWYPGSWILGPLPVPYFLAWIIILVTDYMYQLLMLSKSQNQI